MRAVTLRTERLVLDLPLPGDAALVAEYCQDPLFEKVLTTPWPYTRRHAEFFLGTIVPKGWDSGDELTWAIRSSTPVPQASLVPLLGAPAGAPLLGVIGWKRGLGDIGFWLGAPNRGKGYMTEAVAAVCSWLFDELGVASIGWECVVGNAASASVARKSGFSYTGEFESSLPFRDGQSPPSWHGTLRKPSVGPHGSSTTRPPRPGWPA